MNLSFSHYLNLLRTYLRPQRGRVSLLALLLFAGIGLQLLAPQVIRTFIDTVERGGTLRALMGAALLFLAVVVLQRATEIAATYISQHVAWTATNGLRRDLTRHVLHLDMGFHNAHTPGELLERIDGDVDRLANFFSEFVLQIVSGVLLTLGVLVLLFLEDWRISAALAVFVVAYVLVHLWDQQLAAPEWRKERAYSAELTGFVEERLAGVRDIQTSGAVTHTMARFYEILRRRTWQMLRADVVTDIGWTISKIFYDLGTVVGMGLGAWLYLQGAITLGTVYLIIHYLAMLNWPLDRIARQLEDLQRVRVAVERIQHLTATRSRVTDGGGALLPAERALAVHFDNVRFGYNQDAPVLRDISFHVMPGQTLGLLGRTGSGKSSLARLLFRLYDPQAGRICLDGLDIREIPLTDLRARIGLVTQEVQLFPASVRDNLTLFAPGISDAAILSSLHELGLDGWVRNLPDGLDTPLVANGAGLSAGEGQLLALARVFLKDPGVVILDEASSRLDPATEGLLERALDRLLAGRTSIIIAHRLSTVRRADVLLILEEGRMKEFGPYAELTADPHSVFAGLLRTGLFDLDQREAATQEEVPA